jgi:hypothetical protein
VPKTANPHSTTQDANSSLYARQADSARAMRERTEPQPYENLPFGDRCGARWAGTTTCHCGGKTGCHRTFSGASTFDRHRRGGQCLDPEAAGLALLAGRAYACWGYPVVASEASDV